MESFSLPALSLSLFSNVLLLPPRNGARDTFGVDESTDRSRGQEKLLLFISRVSKCAYHPLQEPRYLYVSHLWHFRSADIAQGKIYGLIILPTHTSAHLYIHIYLGRSDRGKVIDCGVITNFMKDDEIWRLKILQYSIYKYEIINLVLMNISR